MNLGLKGEMLSLSPELPTRMEALPLNTSHPVVRDYLALVRLQVLTPLSLLINIAFVVVCAVVAEPGIGAISGTHPTSITPRNGVIAAYVGAIYIAQIGYCLLLVMGRKTETKVCYQQYPDLQISHDKSRMQWFKA